MTRRLILAYAFLLPFEGVFGLTTFFRAYRIVGLLLILIWLMKGARIRLDSFDAAFVLIIALGLAMAGFWIIVRGSGEFGWALSDTALMLFGFGVYLVVKNELRDLGEAEPVLSAFVLGTVISIVLSLYSQGFETARFEGFYANANRLALAAGASAVIIAAKLRFAPAAQWFRWYLAYGAGFLICVLALIFAGAHGGLIALGAALLAFLMLSLRARSARRRQMGTSLARAAGVLLVVVIGVSAVNTVFTEFGGRAPGVYRLTLPLNESASTRTDLLQGGWNVAVDHYLVGAGTAQYRFLNRGALARLSNLQNPTLAENNLGTHNDYLNLLTAGGIAALLLYAFILVRLYKGLARRTRALRRQMSTMSAVCLPLLVFVVVGGAGAIWIISPDYWLIMAVLILGAREYLGSSSRAARSAVLEGVARASRTSVS